MYIFGKWLITSNQIIIIQPELCSGVIFVHIVLISCSFVGLLISTFGICIPGVNMNDIHVPHKRMIPRKYFYCKNSCEIQLNLLAISLFFYISIRCLTFEVVAFRIPFQNTLWFSLPFISMQLLSK